MNISYRASMQTLMCSNQNTPFEIVFIYVCGVIKVKQSLFYLFSFLLNIDTHWDLFCLLIFCDFYTVQNNKDVTATL